MAKPNGKRGPKIVQRPHPRGERGTKISVDEIVKRVEVGRKDPKTVAWTRETLVRANLGGFKANKMDQAKAILERLRKEHPYFEDPVDAEFMPSAACTLDGCEGLKFMGEDCDGLVIAFLSAVESVGIIGAIVAHSYEPNRVHTHVLAAVLDQKRKVWVRCDPSTDDPFGSSSRPTRETFIGVPGGKVLADEKGPVNVKAVRSPMADMRPSGDFVGVGRPKGDGMVGQTEQAEPGTTGMTEAFKSVLREKIRVATEEAEEVWYQVKFEHRQLELVSEMLGYNLVEPDIAEPGASTWNAEAEKYYRDAEKWTPLMLQYGFAAARGDREVFWDEEFQTVLITGRPGEPFVSMNKHGQFIVKNTDIEGKDTGALGFVVESSVLVAMGLVVVGIGIGYLSLREFMGYAKLKIEERARRMDDGFIQDQVADGVPYKEAVDNLAKKGKIANERARIEIEKEEASPFSKVTKTAESALNAVVVVGMAAAAVYGATLAFDWAKSRKASK